MSSQSSSKPRIKYPRSYLNYVRDPSRNSVDLPSIYDVGCHYYEENCERDYEQAFLWFLKGALIGDSDCMYSLAQMYIGGEYVAADDDSALLWLKKSASLNNLEAMKHLFDIYFKEGSSLYDLKEAKKWADRGYEASLSCSADFKVMQGRIFLAKKQFSRAEHEFRLAGKKEGGADGFYYLGLMHQQKKGFNSSSHDYHAIHYFKKAARAGHEGAIKKLRQYFRIERNG